MRAVIYARVSSVEQVENFSLETQEKACRDYCSRSGWEVVQVFVDRGESAKSTDRPEFQKAIAFCAGKKADVFVVYRLDRFARQTHDHHVVRALLKRHGVTLRSATEPVEDSSTGKLMETMLAGFAQFDNDFRSDRTRAGMKTAVESGRWAWQPPLGYLKGMVPDPERAPLIRKAFELAATGDYNRRELLDRLTGLGLLTRRGQPVPKQTIHAILKNALYAGIVRAKAWGIESEGSFERLIPRETYHRVQAVLKGKAVKAKHERHNPDFPLRSFVRCAEHGLPMTASWSTGRGGKKFGYYRHCASVAKPKLEADFEALLASLSLKSRYLTLFRETTLSLWQKRHEDAERLRSAREIQHAAVKARKDKLVEKFVADLIDEKTYRAYLDRLEAEEAVCFSDYVGAELDERTMRGDLAFAERLLADLRRAWQEFSPAQKLRFQTIVFPDGLSYSAERGFETPVTSPIFSYLRAVPGGKASLVAPTGIEPVLRP